MNDKRPLPTLLIVGGVWLLLAVICWLHPSSAYSAAERRPLKQRPALTSTAVCNGSFMSDFENYALDQFPVRDSFRSLKAVASYYGFQMIDNNGIYLKNGHATKLESPLKESSVLHAAEKLNELLVLCEGYRTAWLCIIPDKNVYLADNYPQLDYDRLYTLMAANMPDAQLLDPRPWLELSDYYFTDTHWRQEAIVDIAAQLAEALEINFDPSFTAETLDLSFHGVYTAQAALPLAGETITLLHNKSIDAATVYNLQTGSTGPVYNMENASGQDPYEIYLSGAAPLLQIDNPTVQNGRRLVVFRDSFAGPLIPLLLQGYESVSLVDTRYISPKTAQTYIDAQDADVLFLYSTILLNNATTLR